MFRTDLTPSLSARLRKAMKAWHCADLSESSNRWDELMGLMGDKREQILAALDVADAAGKNSHHMSGCGCQLCAALAKYRSTKECA